VALPFKKFFNYSEHLGPLPDGPYEVWEKVDGSLGILYWWADKPWIASRGSFTSDQAIRATMMLHGKYKHLWDLFNRDYTYMFEIIYPENRIVVDYGDEQKLVFLGAVHTELGFEIPPHDELGFEIPECLGLFSTKDNILDLMDLEEPNKEGFVLRWPGSGIRLKIKFNEYLHLHRLVTGISARVVWEHLRDNHPMHYLYEKTPDEFADWMNEVVNTLMDNYNKIATSSAELFASVKHIESRKEFALAVKDSPLKGIMFKWLDGYDASDMIWKMLEPRPTSPFKGEKGVIFVNEVPTLQ